MIDGRRRRHAPPLQESSTPSRSALGAIPARFRSLGEWLVRRGVTADQVTLVGMAFAVLTAVMVGLGHLYIGVASLIVGGLMDTLDGVVAKSAGTSSLRGAFFDSVADRVSDALIFGGVCWYFLDGRDPKAAILPVAILAVSAIVSYTRAKAESLGFSGKGGLMERAERLILLGVALAFHVVLIPLLSLLLFLTCLTAVGRFVRVWREASEEADRSAKRSSIEIRWREWREHMGQDGTYRRGRSGSGDIEPLATRLRGVLRSTEAVGSRERRGASRRERSSRAAARRFGTER